MPGTGPAEAPAGQPVRTDPLDEDEAGDDEDRVPVELGLGAVPAEPLAVLEDPNEGEEHGEEAEQQCRRQQRQEEPVALHTQRPMLRPARGREARALPASAAPAGGRGAGQPGAASALPCPARRPSRTRVLKGFEGKEPASAGQPSPSGGVGVGVLRSPRPSGSALGSGSREGGRSVAEAPPSSGREGGLGTRCGGAETSVSDGDTTRGQAWKQSPRLGAAPARGSVLGEARLPGLDFGALDPLPRPFVFA